MKKSIPIKRILLLLAFLAVMVSLQTAVAQDNSNPLPEVQSIPAPPSSDLIIYAAQTNTAVAPIPAPDFGTMKLDSVQSATATITVNFINNADSNWDAQPQAKAAFQYAANIWASLITSSVPIVINAYWENLINPAILGSAGATTIHVNNGNFPATNTWYPAALANSLAGYDMNGSTAEITARFNNARTDWYFGTELSTPFTQYNFATVVLHEIGHGLGFFGSMRYASGIGSWGYETYSGSNVIYPVIYDRFTENGYGQSLLTYGNPSTALGTQLISNYLFFDGVNTRSANGGATAPIYAPTIWRSGSSYSHLGETYNGTENALVPRRYIHISTHTMSYWFEKEQSVVTIQ